MHCAALVLPWMGNLELLKKSSASRVLADSVLIWVIVGFLLLTPALYPGRSAFHYSPHGLLFILACSALNALGALPLFSTMKNDGKASIVVPVWFWSGAYT